MRLFNEGLTKVAIAKKLGTNRVTVRQRLAALGVAHG